MSFYHAGGILVANLPTGEKAYGVAKFNYNYELEDYVIIPYNNDTTHKAGFYNCFDFYDKNALFFIGTNNYRMFTDELSYIDIIKLESNLNILWHKYYGGDRAYFASEVKALEDGGCLITSQYKTPPNYEKRRTVLLKIDQNGLITSTNENQSIPIKNAIVLPNPGSGYLQLHTGMFPATFKLYDINGHEVLVEEINSESTRITTSHLKTGSYIWQLFKKGKEVEKGKWIKL